MDFKKVYDSVRREVLQIILIEECHLLRCAQKMAFFIVTGVKTSNPTYS
jgi:hypothetical protein